MPVPAQYAFFPVLNACLNAVSALLLVVGRVFIGQRHVRAHRNTMIAAVTSSILFLISYLYYHAHVGSVHFQGQGIIRRIYFIILISHTILAAAIVPLLSVTLVRALRRRFDRHRAIARWTFPIWLYVSITGVVVYMMLYQMY